MSEQDKNLISETEDGFDIDWETIEHNVKVHNRRKRHHHHHSSHRHGSSHSSHRHTASVEGTGNVSTDAQGSDSGKESAPTRTMLRHTIRAKDDSEKKRHKKKLTKKKVLLYVLCLLSLLIIGIIVTFFVLNNIGKKELLDYGRLDIKTIDGAKSDDNGLTVSYKGHRYKLNESITSILFMGVDKEELDLVNDAVGTAGQADAIYLIAYDVETGKTRLLSFSRDSMTDINTYATNGDYAGTINAQLCLAYAYGDAHEVSARNVVTSLRRLIFNIPINTYVAMDLNGIAVLNDDVGGVTVNSLITSGDFVEGQEITLKGNQAQQYVRTRDLNQLDSNNNRMQRQQQYINSFIDGIVPAIKRNLTLPITLFNHITPYITTNLNTARVSFLANSFVSDYNGFDTVTIPGEVVAGPDGKAQYITDTKKLYEILLDTYYNRVD